MKPIIQNSFKSAALALGLAVAPFATAGVALITPGLAQAATGPTLGEMKQTLAAYGEFVSHPKYGEVWKPTVTPRGWHPYPACDWVFTKEFGWYFSDKTPWGAIVHHYGRWIHEPEQGWLWVPGAEFSPGWVVWRTSEEWVGWAPTPPDAELTPAAMEAFNDDKLWTFMDAKKFGSTCDGGTSVANFGEAWGATTFVNDIRFIDGVAVFVLPPKIKGPVVKIDIDVFAPWSPTFIGTWINNWTNIFNDVDIIVVKNCGPNDPQDPKEPRDPQQPRDSQNPNNDPVNPKPRSKQLGDAPPPGPGGLNGLRPRQPDRVFNPGRQRQPGGRAVRTFEPQPDDVIVEGRRPGARGPKTFRDPGRFGGRDIDPGFSRHPGGQSGRGPERERQPGGFGPVKLGRDIGGLERFGGGRGSREGRDGGFKARQFDGGAKSFRGGFDRRD